MSLFRQPLLIIACLAAFAPAYAQRPTPAPAQTAPILILGATAHLGTGQVIPNSAVAFEQGKLTLVADATTIRFDRSKYAKIFDASGKHVYPGLIAPNTRLGLEEIEAVRATLDYSDLGGYMPQLRGVVAYSTDSEILPTVRSNGILLAQVTPEGGVISGNSAVVQLDAWNWEDATYKDGDGIWLNWPSLRSGGGFGPGGPGRNRNANNNDQYLKDVQAIRRFFEEGKAYLQAPPAGAKNLRFEAIRALFDKKQNLYVRADQAKAIEEAVLFAENIGVRPVICGGTESWIVAEFLKNHQVPVILGATQALPSRDDDDIDQRFKTPVQLYEKGVMFAFTSIGSWRQRNLPFQAGQACGFGLPKEAAVVALTLNTAKILGIDATCGSLETGKDATLFICEGDVLDMRSSQVTAAFIQGREINLDNKQKQLARQFAEKPRN